MKIIWHRISIQTLLFQACLPTRQNGVENRDTYLQTVRLVINCGWLQGPPRQSNLKYWILVVKDLISKKL